MPLQPTPPPPPPPPPADNTTGAALHLNLATSPHFPAGQQAAEADTHSAMTITPPPTPPPPHAENATGASLRPNLATSLLYPAGQRAAEAHAQHNMTITPPPTPCHRLPRTLLVRRCASIWQHRRTCQPAIRPPKRSKTML
ncbi:uncharacterized protein LOC134528870 [Bacillus rossius redtenbacheri]|uniref:uncharacterized protein LOC134528870 n=1 Tax=Bacillus rossius redtenbacheri TaxID=93214 RepID=UPI002FDD3E63